MEVLGKGSGIADCSERSAHHALRSCPALCPVPTFRALDKMQRPTPAKVPRIEADAPASALGLLDDCHGRDKDVVGEAAPARPGDGPFDGQECPLVRARLLRALYPNHPTDASQRRAPLEAALPSLPPAQAALPATSYYKSPPLRTWRSPGQVLPRTPCTTTASGRRPRRAPSSSRARKRCTREGRVRRRWRWRRGRRGRCRAD